MGGTMKDDVGVAIGVVAYKCRGEGYKVSRVSTGMTVVHDFCYGRRIRGRMSSMLVSDRLRCLDARQNRRGMIFC